MTEADSPKSKLPLIVSLVCVTAIPLTLLLMYVVGERSGTEFSPNDFSRRFFSYNQTPYLNWVIRKKTYKVRTTSIETNLVADGWIQPILTKKRDWHLISDSGSSTDFMSAECDARFLCTYLDLTNDEGDDYWTIWNDEYPKSAKVFWPIVADLARREMYLKIPDVMQFAMEIDTDDVSKFSNDLDTLVAGIYLELGKIDFELNRWERAESRLQQSINAKPSQEAEDLLADCKAKSIPAAGIKAEAEE